MATTTNFGWTTPDDTDLVKDGAAAIRTLGSSIDTSLVDLNGGTTGQVLTKASDTDLDFSFTTPASLPITTEGDLIIGDATGDAVRLPIGSAGTVLTSDGDTADWAAPASASGPAFQAYRAFPTPGHQSISNGVSTKLGFTDEIYDTDSCFDSTTNFRFTPNKAGYYQINLTVGNSSCTGRTIDLFKNGAQDVRPGAGAISGDSALSGGVVMYFNGTTDYVEAFIYLTGTSLLAYGSISGMSFSGVWIRS
jgi:hypothetical protein